MDDAQRVKDDSRMRGEEKAADSRSDRERERVVDMLGSCKGNAKCKVVKVQVPVPVLRRNCQGRI